jgi:hypothetical protein
MRRCILTIPLILILMAGCIPSAPSEPTLAPSPVTGILSVDPQMDLGAISPYVYGSNFGPWTAVPVGRMEYAVNSHLTVLRFPGGSWGDQNDLSEFQVDAFMAFCKQIGAVPTISVRLLNGTPEAAAQLVHYVNVEKKYAVTYWSIGNEPNLYASLPNTQYDTVRYNQEWRAMAKAMKAVDPSIKLMGPEISQFTGVPNKDKYAVDVNGLDWMTEFLKANGDMVDVVSIHRYPFTIAGGQPTTDFLRLNAAQWTQTIRELRQLIHDSTGRDIPVAVTEANSTPYPLRQGEATPDSFYNAIWWGDVLGRLIDENVFMVNQWVMSASSGSSDPLALIAIDNVRPSYYVYQMYQYYGTQRVYASSGIQDVSIHAAKKKNGTLTIMVINLSGSTKQVPLQVKGTNLKDAELWLFDENHAAEDMGQISIPVDGTLELPPQSISLYVIGK